MRRLLALGVIGLLMLPACSGSGAPKEKKKAAFDPAGDKAGGQGQKKDGEKAPSGGKGGVPARAVERKIRYTADLSVIVKDLTAAERGLMALLDQVKGHVARSEVRGSTGEPRQGEWALRVPVEHFQAFRQGVIKLGEPVRNRVDSEDVTEEYYDLQAYIKNMQAEEDTVRKTYEKATGKMEDILAVRKVLGDLRDKIHRAQGRLKLLADLTDLTTVNVTLSEREAYVPDEAPSFATTAWRTLGDSAQALVRFGKGVALVVVALLPWLPVVGLLGLGLWWLARRHFRAAGAQPATTFTSPPGDTAPRP